MRTAGLLCIAGAALALSSAPSSAAAAPAANNGKNPCDELNARSNAVKLLCFDESTGGYFSIKLQHNKLTLLKFHHEILGGTGKVKGLDPQIVKKRVTLHQTAKRLRGNFFIHTKAGYSVGFDPTIVKAPKKAPKLYIVVPKSAIEQRKAARENQQERDRQTQSRYQIADQLLTHTEMQTRPPAPSSAPLQLDIERVAWMNSEPYIKFSVNNRDPATAPELAEIRLSEGTRPSIRAEIVSIQAPGNIDRRLPATVPPTQRADGIVWIPPQLKDRVQSLTMTVYGLDGTLLLSAKLDDYIVPVLPKEEYERQQARERRAKQLIIGIRLLTGACWIPDGLETDNLDATSCTGLGFRLTKGISQLIAFEAEIAALQTGKANFTNVTVGEISGNLTRTASLGRIQLGGVLRFGDRIIPNARIALGLQATSHENDFSAPEAAPGLDQATKFTRLLNIGIGVDIRLGDSLMAGVGTSAIFLGDRLESVDAGVTVSYGWSP